MRVALGLGSSLGDRTAHLVTALLSLHASPEIRVERVSRLYRTPPMRGGTAKGWFLNAVATAQTDLSPEQLLDVCRRLEDQAGRRRARFWGDRPLDLDILLLDRHIITTPTLSVPHPGIANRPFVHIPLLEVWPEALDPRTGQLWREAHLQPSPRPVPIGVLTWPRQ